MESLEHTALSFAYFEVSSIHLVLVNLAATFELTPSVAVGSASCEALLEQKLVVIGTELVCG